MKSFFHFLNEAQSNAAKQAKKLGLVGDGHGSWVDTNGRIVGRTVDGELGTNGYILAINSIYEMIKNGNK